MKEGAAAYFYSRDIGRIWRVAEALQYGIVGINEGIISPKGPLAKIAPFGGMKESGIGANLGGYWGSKYGIEKFLKVKYLCMAASTASWLSIGLERDHDFRKQAMRPPV